MFKSDTDMKVAATTAAVHESDALGFETGNGGEVHQIAGGTHPAMRMQGGTVVSDDENSAEGRQTRPDVA